MKQPLELSYAMRTDTGRNRAVNEDSALAAPPCFLVADGMGGHEAGDLASQAAVRSFARALPEGSHSQVSDVAAALNAARVSVAQVAAGRAHGAGCTITGVVLVSHEGEPHWLVLNIGDSRVYVHRGSELHQLTIDHSLREEVLLGGGDPLGELPGRNVITRALGSAHTTADTWLLPVETGTRLLICSDGLTTELDDAELRATLTMGGQADAVADELVRRANEAGGRDNITVVIVDTVSGGRTWHVGAETSSRSISLIDDTLTATMPRRRT